MGLISSPHSVQAFIFFIVCRGGLIQQLLNGGDDSRWYMWGEGGSSLIFTDLFVTFTKILNCK